jgi:hypothetical protein
LDELAARLDNIAHQPREYFIGLAKVADLHLQQRARFLSRVVSQSCSGFISPRPL